MKKISKRDLTFFLIGLAAMFLFLLIYEWDELMAGFMVGYDDVRNK